MKQISHFEFICLLVRRRTPYHTLLGVVYSGVLVAVVCPPPRITYFEFEEVVEDHDLWPHHRLVVYSKLIVSVTKNHGSQEERKS
jgi:hypothetical protein